MSWHTKPLIVTVLGGLFATNPLYLPFLHARGLFPYADSPWLTAAGVIYLALGVVLVAISIRGVELTFERAVAIGLVSLPVVYLFATRITAELPGNLVYWTPWMLPLALMLPLGAASRRERIGMLGVIFGLLLISPVQLIRSPTGWNGPAMVILWYFILTAWTGILGLPLFLYGRSDLSDEESTTGGSIYYHMERPPL